MAGVVVVSQVSVELTTTAPARWLEYWTATCVVPSYDPWIPMAALAEP